MTGWLVAAALAPSGAALAVAIRVAVRWGRLEQRVTELERARRRPVGEP